MKTIAQSYLTCVDGAHNKHYLAELVEDGGTYRVPCRYGAIGAKLSSTVKYQGPSHNLAMAAFTKVVGEKRAKGYADAPVPASLAATGANVIPADALGREASTGVPRFAAQLAAADYGLVISNYAFTELTREIQDEYLSKVILRAQRGYITYNEITPPSYRSYRAEELLAMIPGARRLPEAPLTHPANCIIQWGP